MTAENTIIRPTSVVFVYRSQEWQVARVLSQNKDKLEVELLGGERMVIAQKRLAHVSEKMVPTADALTAYDAEVDELKRTIRFAEIWAVLNDEQPEATYTIAELADLVLPNAGAAAFDAMAFALFEDPVYFKRQGDGAVKAGSAVSVDECLKRMAVELAERRLIVEGADWLKNPTSERPQDADRIVEYLKDLVLFEEGSRTGKVARKMLKRAFPHDSSAETLMAHKTLLALGEWGPDENIPLLRAGLPTVFSEATIASAEARAAQPLDLDGRVDYRHLPTVAIDDRFTTEVDDALSIVERPNGQVDVYVFIADAAEWVDDGTPVDATANHRVSTLYIPEGKVPMLPSVLSDGVGSLIAGSDRAAMAFVSTFDGLDIVGFRIEEAVVQVDARLTYEDVDEILEWAEHPMSSTVEALMSLADEVRDQRRRGGSITLDRHEVSVHVHDSRVSLDGYRTDDPARRLVSELMILACSETAIWCSEKGIPAMYRSQQAPEETPYIPLDRPMVGYELQRVLRTLRRATLRAEPAPHAGLGVECYTQVTSPLRRYADLLMHRQLKAFLRTGTPRYSKDDLRERFDHLESIASSQRQVERHSRRYWTLKHLETMVGTQVEGEVIRQIGRRWLVDLVDFGVQAPWSPSRPPSLGDLVTVKLKTVNPRRDKLVII